jgi:hypothetical protein
MVIFRALFVPSTLSSWSDFCTLYVGRMKSKNFQKSQKKSQESQICQKKPKLGYFLANLAFLAFFGFFGFFLAFLEIFVFFGNFCIFWNKLLFVIFVGYIHRSRVHDTK